MAQSPELQVALAKVQMDFLRSEFGTKGTIESLTAYKAAVTKWATLAAALDKTRKV